MTSLDDLANEAGKFLATGTDAAGKVLPISSLTNTSLPLGQILMAIATGILVIATVIMGIKFITGGPEGQAKMKGKLIGLIVSTVVIFGAQVIWSMTYNIMQKFDDTGTSSYVTPPPSINETSNTDDTTNGADTPGTTDTVNVDTNYDFTASKKQIAVTAFLHMISGNTYAADDKDVSRKNDFYNDCKSYVLGWEWDDMTEQQRGGVSRDDFTTWDLYNLANDSDYLLLVNKAWTQYLAALPEPTI